MKALGNKRPKIISDVEKVIWKEIFDVAEGEQTVHKAASNIVENISDVFENVNAETRGWFMLSMLH